MRTQEKAVIAAAAMLFGVRAWAGDIGAQVLDAEGKPVEDAVVFVFEIPGGKFTPPEEPAVMNQISKEFSPHVLPVLAGTKVSFPNKDQIHHHLYSFSKAKKFELPLYKGDPPPPVLFDVAGVVKLGCNIHDWMLGYILVLDNPYFARTGPDGRAAISGVPKGTYKVAVWSERLKGGVEDTLQSAVVGAKAAKLVFKPKLGAARKHPAKSSQEY